MSAWTGIGWPAPHRCRCRNRLRDRITPAIGFVWSPVAAWLMAGAALLGYWAWAALHVASVLLLRRPLLIGLALVSYGFWFDVAQGNTVTFVFVTGALALRGSRGSLAYLALLRPDASPADGAPGRVVAAVEGPYAVAPVRGDLRQSMLRWFWRAAICVPVDRRACWNNDLAPRHYRRTDRMGWPLVVVGRHLARSPVYRAEATSRSARASRIGPSSPPQYLALLLWELAPLRSRKAMGALAVRMPSRPGPRGSAILRELLVTSLGATR